MRRWHNRPWPTLTALLVAMCAAQWLGAGEAVAANLTVVAAATSRTDHQVSVVVDVQSDASTPVPPQALSVTAAGVPQPVQAVPVLSDKLAVGVVVDASEAGSSALQTGLGGITNFMLEHPTSGAVIVADTSPPVLASPTTSKLTDVVEALSSIRPGGQRDTSAAVSLAQRELATIPAPSRMVLLYTTAADLGGEPAADLAARLIDAHTILAVVSNAPDVDYWREATRLTGGVLVSPESGRWFNAFDEVGDTLRNRFLLTFPAPERLPADVTVRLDLPGGTSATADAVVQEPSAGAAGPGDAARGGDGGGPPWVLIMGIAALIAGGLAFLRWGPRARRAVAAGAANGGSSRSSVPRLSRTPPVPLVSRLGPAGSGARPREPATGPPVLAESARETAVSRPEPARRPEPATSLDQVTQPVQMTPPQPATGSPRPVTPPEPATSLEQVTQPVQMTPPQPATGPPEPATSLDQVTQPVQVTPPEPAGPPEPATGPPKPATGPPKPATPVKPATGPPGPVTRPKAAPPAEPSTPPNPATAEPAAPAAAATPPKQVMPPKQAAPPRQAAPPKQATRAPEPVGGPREPAAGPPAAAAPPGSTAPPEPASPPEPATSPPEPGAGPPERGNQPKPAAGLPKFPPRGAPPSYSSVMPPPHPPLMKRTPRQDSGAGPPVDQGLCMCGCGMKVRPGKAFFSREHQTRWMSQRGGRSTR